MLSYYFGINKLERVSEMPLGQMDHLHYSPRSRKIRIIIKPLFGKFIQFSRENQNESSLLYDIKAEGRDIYWEISICVLQH